VLSAFKEVMHASTLLLRQQRRVVVKFALSLHLLLKGDRTLLTRQRID